MEDADDRKKRLANARQKRYYAKNKESITTGFQKKRDALKTCQEQDAVRAMENLNINDPEPEQPHQEPEPIPEPEAEVAPKKRGRKPNTVYDIAFIKDKLNDLSECTKKTYYASLDVIFRAMEGDNMAVFLKNFNKVKSDLEGVKKIRGNADYGLSAMRTHIKVIVLCCDPKQGVNVPITDVLFRKYREWYKLVTLEYDDQRKGQREDVDNAVIDFDVYKDKILEKFGTDSKEFLIVSLYNEATLRDDFGELVIVVSDREIDGSKKGNYLINPRGKTVPCKLVIQNYKTAKHNGDLKYTLSKSLTKLIRNYIESNELTDKLFPQHYTSGLSAFVAKMSKSIMILQKGGINYFRHSKISSLLNNGKFTPEDRVKLATSMGHSLNIQSEYARFLKEN